MLLRVFNLYACTYTHMHLYTCTHTHIHLYSCTHPYTYGGWEMPQVTYPPPDYVLPQVTYPHPRWRTPSRWRILPGDVPSQVTSYDIVLYSMHAKYAIKAHNDFCIGAKLSPLSTTNVRLVRRSFDFIFDK